ncbi:MAG: hypothetical protein HG454_006665 [Clostridiales bacterium]|nr:hypothetical protein [Clostridiales bacterium]
MYHKQGTDLVNADKELVRKQGTKVIQRDFSKIVDGKIRHDSDAISLAIMQIVLSDIRYSLKDKKVMTLALEAVLRKHKKIQNIKDRKLRKAEKNTRKKNDKLVKKLRKQGKTEKEIQDIIFREISTKEELINNIEQKERQKVKGESATSRFIEKYNDRINAIKEADKKESPEEKKLFENFFKKTRKVDNTKKVDEKQEKKNNDTKKENITEEETKFNTISIHALLDRKTKGNTETVKTVTNNVTEDIKEESPRKEKSSDIYAEKNKEIDVEKEVERLENKIIKDTENKVSRHISLNNIIEKDMSISLNDYFKKDDEFQDEEKEKKRSLNKLREEFRESLKEEKIENAPSLNDLLRNVSKNTVRNKMYDDGTKIEEHNFDININPDNIRKDKEETSSGKENNKDIEKTIMDNKVSQRTMEFNISELENKMVESVNEIYKDTDDSKIGFKEKFEIEEIEAPVQKPKRKTRRQREREEAKELMQELSKLDFLRENRRKKEDK